MDRIGEARFVLLGEASHGTSEFYQWRARLSSRLIAEKGFNFVAVEGDWRLPCLGHNVIQYREGLRLLLFYEFVYGCIIPFVDSGPLWDNQAIEKVGLLWNLHRPIHFSTQCSKRV